MNTRQFSYTSDFPCSAKELYQWHKREGALERLIPPWENTSVIHRQGGIAPGGKVTMKMHAGPIPFKWHARHIEDQPGKMFRDIQDKGPFASWSHTHLFRDTSSGSQLEDRIDFALPGQGFLPKQAENHIIQTLKRTFNYRHQTLAQDLKLHAHCSQKPLTLLITGSSGVLGRAMIPLLATGGHQVWTLVRRMPKPGCNEVYWDPANEMIDHNALPRLDGVIHLAGEYIGAGRWNNTKKKMVVDSRVQGTRLIAKTIASLPHKPEVLLSASAVGFYGNCLDCCMGEEDSSGLDFISDVCSLWEGSAKLAEDAGIRTVFMRIGVVLSPKGGALQRLLSTSRVGFFKQFGSGKQYISWIGIDDMISVVLHALTCKSLEGPVNIASPQPVTNQEMMQTLADIFKRPLLPAIPAKFLRAVYGQMATEVILSGCRVSTDKLQNSGYQFRHRSLEEAVRVMLGIHNTTATGDK